MGAGRGEAGEMRGKWGNVPHAQQERAGFLTEGEAAKRCFLMRQKMPPNPQIRHEQVYGLRNTCREAWKWMGACVDNGAENCSLF